MARQQREEKATEEQPIVVGEENPSLTGQVTGLQTIPGPRDMTGTVINSKKESRNKKYHAEIAKKYGDTVVHTRDNVILLNGMHYGPGLVDCGEGVVKGYGPNGEDVPVVDIIRAAVDRVYEHPEEVEEAVEQPKSPTDTATAQFTHNLGADVTPRVEGQPDE